MTEANTITIAGRNYQGITQELSAVQDDYLMGQLRLAGALEVFAAPALAPAAGSEALPDFAPSPEELAESLLTQILISGRASQILAGCLTPEGEQWTVGCAEHNAKKFAAITDAHDKAAMRGALIAFVLGFFRYATASVATSRSSSIRK